MRARVCFITTGLELGGAELALARLLKTLDQEQIEPLVISLSGTGPVAEMLRDSGIGLQCADWSASPLLAATRFRRLVNLIRAARPDVVQTWMYHADLFGGAAARLAGTAPVFWGIRNGVLDWRATKLTTKTVVRCCARLSTRIPDKIVSCALSAQEAHIGLGYTPDKFVVIPNGVDTDYFRFDVAGRARVRREFGIPGQCLVVGYVARFHQQKDHRTFLRAAALLANRRATARYVLCGPGCEASNLTLMQWIREFGLQDRVHLLGPRRDMPAVLSSFDLHTITSTYGEAFPNVVAESMACERPGVVTDVGDAARISGNEDFVVAQRDPEAVAGAWERVFALTEAARSALGRAARQRIMDHFSLAGAAANYTRLYQSVRPNACAV